MRTCRVCHLEKPLMDFYVHTSGNLDRRCKECTKAYVRQNRLLRLEQYVEYERGRANLPHRVEARKGYAQTPNGKEAHARAHRRFVEKNPVKRLAHSKTWHAIRDGRLVRQACEVCGEAKAHAHHDDYGKPLDVRWLCTKHHAEWHKYNTPKCPDQEQSA